MKSGAKSSSLRAGFLRILRSQLMAVTCSPERSERRAPEPTAAPERQEPESAERPEQPDAEPEPEECSVRRAFRTCTARSCPGRTFRERICPARTCTERAFRERSSSGTECPCPGYPCRGRSSSDPACRRDGAGRPCRSSPAASSGTSASPYARNDSPPPRSPPPAKRGRTPAGRCKADTSWYRSPTVPFSLPPFSNPFLLIDVRRSVSPHPNITHNAPGVDFIVRRLQKKFVRAILEAVPCAVNRVRITNCRATVSRNAGEPDPAGIGIYLRRSANAPGLRP